MKIAIVGGGASGSYLAIRLKEINPSFVVSLFEKNDKLLKKIAVTGNGRCNYANIGELKNKYNHPFANEIINQLPPKDIIKSFDRLGVHPTYIDNLVYPVSLSAQTVILMFEKRLEELNVNIHLNEEVADYQKSNQGYLLKTNQKEYPYDVLIFSSGGKAYPQLGTNGAILAMLEKHGYIVTELSPTLSPIKVKENVKKISGQRVKAHVSLLSNNELFYEEDGEVLFKDDGLSGIVMLNMSSKINLIKNKNNVRLVLDLASGYQDIKENEYSEYVHPKIANYLKEHQLNIHQVSFSFKGFYDFNIAEVSHGGISLNEITNVLESKKEKGIFFTGEVLDIDGMCGGYNLMFAFASAEVVAKAIKE